MCLDISRCAILYKCILLQGYLLLVLVCVSFLGILTAVRMFSVVNPALRIFTAVVCVQFAHCEDIYCCALKIYGFNFDLLHRPGCSSLLLYERSMVRGHSSEGLEPMGPCDMKIFNAVHCV
jgi:hypothetical protein